MSVLENLIVVNIGGRVGSVHVDTNSSLDNSRLFTIKLILHDFQGALEIALLEVGVSDP